jgi:hypothetical protein
VEGKRKERRESAATRGHLASLTRQLMIFLLKNDPKCDNLASHSNKKTIKCSLGVLRGS